MGQERKRMLLKMPGESSVYMMAINETMQEQSDRRSFVEKRKTLMAGRAVIEYDIIGPVRVHFANKTAMCNAFVQIIGSGSV